MMYLFNLLNIFSISIGMLVSVYFLYIFKRCRQRKYLFLSMLFIFPTAISILYSFLYLVDIQKTSALFDIITFGICLIGVCIIYIGPAAIEYSIPGTNIVYIKFWGSLTVLLVIFTVIIQFFNPELFIIIYFFQAAAILYNCFRCLTSMRKNRSSRGSLSWAVYMHVFLTMFFLPLKVVFDFPTPIRILLFPNIPFWVRVAPIHYICAYLPFLILIFQRKLLVEKNDKGRDYYLDFAQLYKLSVRETEVMELLIDGESYNDISDKLCISMSTVKSHTNKIYQKTNTNRRAALHKLLMSGE